jgi:hypothetical protein
MVVLEVPGDGLGTGVEACALRDKRSSTIRSTTSAPTAVGDDFGRRERGSKAASPSAR